MKQLNDWLEGVAELTPAQRSLWVKKIALDSRELDENTWWLATRGIHHHALDFYHAQQSCAGILYEPPYDNPPPGAIAVPHLGKKLSGLAGAFYDHPSQQMQVIGVTGTDGKSSLVHFLAQSLDAAMLGTIGYGQLGQLTPASHTTPDALTVQCLLRQFADQGCAQVAMEVSSHALDQGRVADVDFAIGVFSNLSRDHLDYHPDMESYFLAKAGLFARDLQHAIINLDDPYGQRLIEEGHIRPGTTLWGVSSHGRIHPQTTHSVMAENIEFNPAGLSMTLSLDGQSTAIQTQLLARFNVDNVLNVAACLAATGHSLADIAQIIPAMTGVPGRVENIALGNQRCAIVDYAHTGGAIESVLSGIRPHVAGKLWIVFGCGGDRDRGKRPLMAASAERFADHVMITDDNPRTEDPAQIVADVAAGLSNPQAAHIVQPREKAIVYALERLAPGDIVVIAGKGHEDYQIIGTHKMHFSDQEVVRTWRDQ